jgi:hypothetical protein
VDQYCDFWRERFADLRQLLEERDR